ncbi:hypothetical protein B0H17DRAFT_1150638 [Mycena rosella]|uniref:Uncharacterized protein n=1 Tax=Mycena rosella TaxID=1033263 RepID=A0AAD7BTJ7_MYCRO|nr:hypothetical protein B0H17DRAFT_1150638 [Mycena rosella]
MCLVRVLVRPAPLTSVLSAQSGERRQAHAGERRTHIAAIGREGRAHPRALTSAWRGPYPRLPDGVANFGDASTTERSSAATSSPIPPGRTGARREEMRNEGRPATGGERGCGADVSQNSRAKVQETNEADMLPRAGSGSASASPGDGLYSPGKKTPPRTLNESPVASREMRARPTRGIPECRFRIPEQNPESRIQNPDSRLQTSECICAAGASRRAAYVGLRAGFERGGWMGLGQKALRCEVDSRAKAAERPRSARIHGSRLGEGVHPLPSEPDAQGAGSNACACGGGDAATTERQQNGTKSSPTRWARRHSAQAREGDCKRWGRAGLGNWQPTVVMHGTRNAASTGGGTGARRAKYLEDSGAGEIAGGFSGWSSDAPSAVARSPGYSREVNRGAAMAAICLRRNGTDITPELFMGLCMALEATSQERGWARPWRAEARMRRSSVCGEHALASSRTSEEPTGEWHTPPTYLREHRGVSTRQEKIV